MKANYEDVPAKFRLVLPITYRDRIDGVCYDKHHCTIANAIHVRGRAAGITMLCKSGVSNTLVRLYLDPKVHKWAKAGQEYKARLTEAGTYLVKELDDYWDKPQEHQRLKARLVKEAASLPQGLDTQWDAVTLVAPLAGQKKDSRAGSSGKVRGPRNPSGVPSRRYNGSVWGRSTATP